MNEPHVFIRCPSHRCRDRVEKLIPEMESWFCMKFGTGQGYAFKIPASKLSLARTVKSVTKARLNEADWSKCWNWGNPAR